MSIESSFYSVVTADATVAGLIVDRVFIGIAPDDVAKPYCSYTPISGGPISSFSGLSTIESRRLQVDCYADTAPAALTLCDAIIAAVDSGMKLGDVSKQYFYESDTRLHRYSADFSLWE